MSHHPLRQLPFWAIAAFALSGSVRAATPQIVSVSPSSGSGQTQTFTLTVSDADGASDVSSIDMLINGSFDKNNACWMYFGTGANQVWIYGDGGVWEGPIGPGGNTAQNSQCAIQFLSSSSSGNDVSFTVSITFSSAWLGAKTIWGESLDQEKDDSGYQQVGTYTVVHQGPTQDFSVAVTPDHLDTTPGHLVNYTFALTSINGFSARVNCTPTASPQPSGLSMFTLDSEGGLTSAFTIPADGTATGTLRINTDSSTPPTTGIAITLACQDNNLQHSAQTTLNLDSPETPTVSITPASGNGSTQTFTINATDSGGFTAIGNMNFLISPSFDGTNACWLYYLANTDPQTKAPSGTLSLASDDTSSWSSTAVTSDPNNVTPLFNSQCSVFPSSTTVSGSGDTLTLMVTVTFTASFTGPKNLYVRAGDVGGPDSGYQQLGTFTTQAGNGNPDFDIIVSPTSQSITGAGRLFYSATVHGVYGYSNTVTLSISGLPPDSTVVPETSFSIQPSQAAYFYVMTAGDTPTGNYTPTVTGTDGTLTNSQTFGVNVTGASVPTLSTTPDSGTGTTQTFVFTATGTAQAQPQDMDVLFNTTLNGAHGCWIYGTSSGETALASDDGSLWQVAGFNTTVQNSQCSVTSNPGQDPTGQMSINVTITFSSSFSGTKNIYVDADNTQGGNTGYQLQGTWTIP